MKSSNRTAAGLRAQAILCALCLGLIPAAPSWALATDREQPITVEADGVEINDRTGVSVYEGNVVIRQGSIRIEADRVTVHQKSTASDKVIAEGTPVRFQQQPDEGDLVQGRARRAEYKVDSELLHLIGNAHLSQGSDSFASDRISYDRAQAVVKAGASAKGQQRVKVTIEPGNSPSGP